MKTPVHLAIAAVLAAGSTQQISAAITVVGPGTEYEDLANFDGAARSNAEFGLLNAVSLGMGDPQATAEWNLTSGGGLNVGTPAVPPLVSEVILASSQGYAEIAGNTLTFGSSSSGVLGDIASAGLTYTWDARAALNGSVTLAPSQLYQVSFNVDIDPTVVGLLEGVSVEVFDVGTDAAIAGLSDADLLSALGLFGGSGSGTVTLDFATPAGVGSELGIRFQGSQTADAGLLSAGDEPIYEFSSLSVAAVPEPGIGLTSLLGVTTLLLRKRRKSAA
jgi:hypothetical protein